jgi:hypothetical protein
MRLDSSVFSRNEALPYQRSLFHQPGTRDENFAGTPCHVRIVNVQTSAGVDQN